MIEDKFREEGRSCRQAWFFDDGYFVGSKEDALRFWNVVKTVGPTIGYQANNKSKVYDLDDSNKDMWVNAGLTFSSIGMEVLGAPVGSQFFIKEFAHEKYERIKAMINMLTNIAHSNPQESFAVFSRSIKHKHSYMTRTINNCNELAHEYDQALEQFMSVLFGKVLTEKMVLQASLPIGKGGLGLNVNSEQYCSQQYEDSQTISYGVVRNITHDEMIPENYEVNARKAIKSLKNKYWSTKTEELKLLCNDSEKIRLEELNMSGANSWINYIPIASKPHRMLSKSEFTDALRLRFEIKPDDLPIICPAIRCQEAFSLNHADICSKGGIIHRRHDYIKWVLARNAEKAFGSTSVEIEPTLGKIESDAHDILTGNLNDLARSDFSIRDYHGPHSKSHFDVRVLSPTCESNRDATIHKSIAKAEKSKNKDYADRIKNYVGGSFFPCVFTSGGGIGPAANKVISDIARKASLSSLERYEVIKEEIKRDVVFSLIKSRIQGIRSSKNCISSQTYCQNDIRV